VRFLSPAIVMQDALNDIAGTGTARHRGFMNQVESYHQRWRAYFVPLVFQRARLQDYSGLPGFTFVEEELGTVTRRVALSMMGLLIPSVAIGAFAVGRIRRYPVVG
jgi:ABC-2 type transport system permease protein